MIKLLKFVFNYSQHIQSTDQVNNITARNMTHEPGKQLPKGTTKMAQHILLGRGSLLFLTNQIKICKLV